MFPPAHANLHVFGGVRRRAVLALLGATLLTAACAGPKFIVEPPRQVTPDAWPAARASSHVVIVSIDGLRPDAITSFQAPTLRRLIAEGSYTLTATTVMPSKTLPSHTSMLTGMSPEEHGVHWNNVLTADADLIEAVSVFGVARARGYVTAAFYSKPKFQPLQQPGTLDYSQAPGGWWGGWDAKRTMGDVERYLTTTSPNLLFVHLAEPDRAGHGAGWMSARYGRAVEAADAAIARLLVAADRRFGAGRYTLIVTADHGGHDKNHGSDDPRDVTIPWIAWGLGVRPGELTGPTIRTMDTASTALWLLGVETPGTWSGTPVLTAFQAVAAGSGG